MKNLPCVGWLGTHLLLLVKKRRRRAPPPSPWLPACVHSSPGSSKLRSAQGGKAAGRNLSSAQGCICLRRRRREKAAMAMEGARRGDEKERWTCG